MLHWFEKAFKVVVFFNTIHQNQISHMLSPGTNIIKTCQFLYDNHLKTQVNAGYNKKPTTSLLKTQHSYWVLKDTLWSRSEHTQ